MSYTSDISVGPDGFTILASNEGMALVQLKTQGRIVVQLAQATPANDSIEGIIMDSDGLVELAFGTIEADDLVYARSLTDDTETVAVVNSGTSGR